MDVFQGVAAARRMPELALCLGNFDGVHVGHQALFAAGVGLCGQAGALTFHPHPGKVLQPELAPKLITLLPRRLELLEACGLAATVVQPFSADYAHTSAEAFEAALFDVLSVGGVVVGHDFTYGQNRSGTVASLRAAAEKRGRKFAEVPAVTVDGVVASSSRIREYILEGRVLAAQRLLGRPFDLDGVVVRGQGRGRTIGFPTANVDTANELRPAPGVYAVRVKRKDEEVWRGGAANIGVKPTFGGVEVTIEVHLWDYGADLYGKELRVQFLDRIRAEQRFASVLELTEQIKRDVEVARATVARF